jgi:hypothetical protein
MLLFAAARSVAFVFVLGDSGIRVVFPDPSISEKLVGAAYSSSDNTWSKCWGTPSFGEYTASDPDLLAYHAAILSDAGVDFIFPDWANNSPFHPLTYNYVFRTGESFDTESEYPWIYWTTEDLYAVAGDFNGDGLEDVGHWSATTGKWRFLYAPAFEHAQGWGNCLDWTAAKGTNYYPFAGDFNGDGISDLGLRDASTGIWYARLSTAAKIWSTSDTILADKTSGSQYQPFTGDFNGDGTEDIGMRDPNSGMVYFWTGPLFTQQSTYEWTSGTGYRGFSGDFNGDGVSDIALHDQSSGDVSLKYGPSFSAGQTVAWPTKQGDYWTPIAGDWDADGRSDIGLHNRSPYRSDLKSIENNTFALLDAWSSLSEKPKMAFMLGIRDVDHLTDGRFQAKVDYVYDEIAQSPVYGPMVQTVDGKPLLLIWTRCPTLFPGGIPSWTDDRFTVRFGTAYLDHALNGDLLEDDPNLLTDELGDETRAIYGHWSWEQREVRAYSVDEEGRPECMTVQTAYRPGQALDAQPNTDGLFFEETWRTALNLDPGIVLIPTFNEWNTNEHAYAEIARDLEPSVEFGTLFMDILKEQAALYKSTRSDIVLRNNSTGDWTAYNAPDFYYRTDFSSWVGGAEYQAVAGSFMKGGKPGFGLRKTETGTFFIRSAAENLASDSQVFMYWPSRTGTVYQAFCGDFNGDGISDPGVRDTSTGIWYVRQSTAAETWSASETIVATKASGSHYQPFTGDFNGDGEWDIGMRDPNNGKYYFWAGPDYTQSTYQWTSGAGYSGFSGDFNGDGFWDIGLRNESTGRIEIRSASTDGTLTFGTAQTFETAPSGSDYSVMSVDVR